MLYGAADNFIPVLRGKQMLMKAAIIKQRMKCEVLLQPHITDKHYNTRKRIPVCRSPHKGCRILPGSRKLRRSPRHFGSHRNTPLGWCTGRSGQCRLASLLNSQTSLCHSSDAYSSCNAVQHTHFKTFLCHYSGKYTRTEHF